MSVLYLDCVGGIAGDMLLASLIDAGAALDPIRGRLPVGTIGLEVDRVERQGVGALALTVVAPEEHVHRTWRDVRVLIDASPMSAGARARAHIAFELLARAEGRVHGVPAEEVFFHEVGALDAIADICGVSLALEQLGIEEVVCSPLPLGGGFTQGAHGTIPLPAPATLELLSGAAVYGIADEGETVTPTGAALVAALATSFGPMPPMTLSAVGVGAGTRDPRHRPNIVRAMIGTRDRAHGREEPGPMVLETNLDDLAPELVPDVVAACLAAGAADAWTTPVVMKRGRPGITLSVLVAAEHERAVAEAILRHSTALGLRVRRTEHRWTLDREFRTVDVRGHEISVKLGLLDGEVVNIKPEHRDCVRAAEVLGTSVKEVRSAALARAHDELHERSPRVLS
ncbi:nickel pincer cofactor biosynthesis protein LarC [Nocardia vinacea]|uniref:Pyridinium-3,5-bisthiocarboxylic acid mononucleotide nickel insertion protein n=1 Tax=Nocardia vinacea TaxID=96468 RepID=A0ABZ1YW18_9NOCA|nr:nickel pincer cofactor biosynthesis protein LarC [Nocardia vinacea]